MPKSAKKTKKIGKAKKIAAGKKASKPKRQTACSQQDIMFRRPARILRKVRYIIDPVPEQFVFHIQDGGVLRNLTDLINALDSMDDGVFCYHANHQKNDFSNWIRDIIEEPDLSMNICGKSRLAAKNEIISFLKNKGKLKG